MKTILATTYAVHPTKGSEDAMGWNYILQIARFNRVICVTRVNNQPAIDLYIKNNPAPIYDNIRFLYFDTPKWTRFWKRGSRGAMVYYWMWQRAIPAFIKKNKLTFDIAHNVTFPNDWTPSFLWKLGKPFVWGPIGHHPLIPKQYLAPYKSSYFIKDRLTWLVKNCFWKLSPALKKTAKKADFIYAMNHSVASKITLKKDQHFVRPSVATQDFGFNTKKDIGKFHIISAGRFVPLKGFDLTLLAFASFIKSLPKPAQHNIKLTLVGKGPEEQYYKHLIKQEGIIDCVEIINWVERPNFLEIMKQADVFLFPSHEGAGMVVAEALSFGLPVICLDNCGPGEFITSKCGITVAHQSYQNTIQQLSNAINELYSNPRKHKQMSTNARVHFVNNFNWDKRGDWLNEIYDTIDISK